MITGIDIERLRGIHEGTLEGLTALTVLVGPSGSGKSTVLDALLIGASSEPGEAIGRVVQRRAELPAGVPWLFEKRAATASIRVRGEGTPSERALRLAWYARDGQLHVSSELATNDATLSITHFEVDNSFDPGTFAPSPPMVARLIEAVPGAQHASLVRIYDDAFQSGRAFVLREILPSILAGAKDLRIGTYRDADRDLPLLHVDFGDHSVPVAGAGSGIYAIVRLALELALPEGSVVMVEEPEAHQHPAIITQTARLLIEASRRGVQVIVSTHSLELIDALLSNAKPADIDRLTVLRVVLDGGVLRSSRFAGPIVASARSSIDEDLR